MWLLACVMAGTALVVALANRMKIDALIRDVAELERRRLLDRRASGATADVRSSEARRAKSESPAASRPTRPDTRPEDGPTRDVADQYRAWADAAAKVTGYQRPPLTSEPEQKTDAAEESQPKPEPWKTPEPKPALQPEETAKASLEERLGARIFVWIGGVALALAGAFGVKLGYEHVVLTEVQRVWAGVAFAAALLAGAWWARKRSPRVASAMAGASVAVGYGCVLAATRLYALIDPSMGFVLTAVVTAGAVGLSLRFGQLVTVLGMLGGFAMPALLGGGGESFPIFVCYLLALQAGLVWVASRREWRAISGLALAATLLWSLAGLWLAQGQADRLWVTGLLVVTSMTHLWSNMRQVDAGVEGPIDWRMAQVIGACVAAALGVAGVAVSGGYTALDLGLLALVGAGTVVLARVGPAYFAVACVAAGVSWVVTLMYGSGATTDRLIESAPVREVRLAWLCVAFAGVYGLGGWIVGRRRFQHANFAGRKELAALSGTAAFAFVSLALWVLPTEVWRWTLTAGAAITVAALGAAARPWRSAASRVDQREAAAFGLAAWGLAIVASSVLVPWEAKALAWGVCGLAACWVVRRGGNAIVRAVLASSATLGVMGLVTLTPVLSELEAWPKLTMLGLQFAAGLAVLIAAYWCWRRVDARATAAGQPDGVIDVTGASLWAVVGYAAVAAIWLVRHGFHATDWMASIGTTESATLAAIWLLAGAGLQWIAARRKWDVLERAGLATALAGAVLSVCLPLLALSPLLQAISIGRWPVVNGLLWLYGVPIIAAGLVARVQRGRRPLATQLAGVLALTMLFAYVSLQVRQLFVGPVLALSVHEVSQTESYAYSVAWVMLGLLLLLGGLLWRAAWLRIGSLVVMLLAIGKAFLLDASTLEGVLRVLSFLGLGLSLMVLGYVYQRFVFAREVQNGHAEA